MPFMNVSFKIVFITPKVQLEYVEFIEPVV